MGGLSDGRRFVSGSEIGHVKAGQTLVSTKQTAVLVRDLQTRWRLRVAEGCVAQGKALSARGAATTREQL